MTEIEIDISQEISHVLSVYDLNWHDVKIKLYGDSTIIISVLNQSKIGE